MEGIYLPGERDLAAIGGDNDVIGLQLRVADEVIFSRTSDVWTLGLMVLELVTPVTPASLRTSVSALCFW